MYKLGKTQKIMEIIGQVIEKYFEKKRHLLLDKKK